jgi:hypothetical protein
LLNQHGNLRSEEIINPYNWCGILHNGALDTLANSEAFPNIDSSEAIEMIENYYYTHTGDTCNLSYEVYLEGITEDPWPFSKSIEIFLDNELMIQAQFDYVLKLEDIFLTDSSLNYASTEIRDLEIELYYDNELSTDQKVYVWYMLAISKYSYQYWFNAFTDNENPWYSILNGSKMPFGRWCAVHAADFWGANEGFWMGPGGLQARIDRGNSQAAYASWCAGQEWDYNH